ncbi:MAG: 4-(cytidine 5'-diphospho)-2-C-methyl-D-erythritol kinase [Spirochaetales bacterium]|nr:4-(cytidine 5'-diphospho)-2-C-methyl-D-erythritol kinase [Spirochaetales bacterium]
MKALGSILSPCKINLHLDVLEKRPDGFHDLLSIFVQCDLYDKLEFFGISGKGCFSIEDASGIPEKENILYKTYEILKKRLPDLPSLRVLLQKEIPLEAGLGGGSSNAAAMLCFVNALLGKPLDKQSLMDLGAELGSDVPFFLGSPQAVVSGRGETLHSLSPRTDYQVLLINPGFGISTAKAFQAIDKQSGPAPYQGKFSISQLTRLYEESDPLSWPFFNSFYPVVSVKHDFFKVLMQKFAEHKCLFSGLSGSGASVFAIFQDKREAEKAFFCFRKQYFFVKLIFPLAKSTQPVLQ